MEKFKRNRKGVTLIELLLALGLIGILIQIVYSMYFVSNDSFAISTNKGFSQKSVRLVSDFIVSELKYTDTLIREVDFDVNNMLSNYYSIELRVNDDGTSDLIRREFDKDGTEKSKKSVNGKWEQVHLYNTSPGVINVKTKQLEGNNKNKAGFELLSEIRLENNPLLLSEIDIVLDGTNKLYYTLPKDTAVVSIDVPPENSNPNNPNPENPNPGNTNPVKLSLSIESVDEVIEGVYKKLGKNTDGEYLIGKGENFRIKVIIKDGTGNFTVNVPTYKAETSPDKRTITVNGQSDNGNDKKFEIIINVTDEDFINKPKETIKLSFRTYND